LKALGLAQLFAGLALFFFGERYFGHDEAP
jgi:hypothetical protein